VPGVAFALPISAKPVSGQFADYTHPESSRPRTAWCRSSGVGPYDSSSVMSRSALGSMNERNWAKHFRYFCSAPFA